MDSIDIDHPDARDTGVGTKPPERDSSVAEEHQSGSLPEVVLDQSATSILGNPPSCAVWKRSRASASAWSASSTV
jgi:hypothetical protein